MVETGPNLFSGSAVAVFDQFQELQLDTDLDGVGDLPSGVLVGVADDNGGLNETVALRGDRFNPALDAGSDAIAPEGNDGRDTIYPRIVDLAGTGTNLDDAVDLGAYEWRGLSYDEAKRVAYTYEAGLDRDGDIDLPGLNFWIDVRENLIDPVSEIDLAAFFLDSPEFQANVEAFLDDDVDINSGNVRDDAVFSHENYVIFLYENVLDRAFDQPGFDFWLSVLGDLLQNPATVDAARERLLLFFADSPENQMNSPIVETLEETSLGDWEFV